VVGNEVVMLLAQQVFPLWFLALFALAAVLSAIVPAGPIIMMSCTLLSHNVYAKLVPSSEPKTIFAISRGLVFVVTFLALLLAVVAHTLIALVLLAAYNFIAQLVPGILIGGLFWRRATRDGVIAGLVIGWALTVYFLLNGISAIDGMNSGFVALVANTIVFFLVSLITKPVRAEILDEFLAAAHGPRKQAASAGAAASPLPAE